MADLRDLRRDAVVEADAGRRGAGTMSGRVAEEPLDAPARPRPSRTSRSRTQRSETASSSPKSRPIATPSRETSTSGSATSARPWRGSPPTTASVLRHRLAHEKTVGVLVVGTATSGLQRGAGTLALLVDWERHAPASYRPLLAATVVGSAEELGPRWLDSGCIGSGVRFVQQLLRRHARGSLWRAPSRLSATSTSEWTLARPSASK